MGGRKDLRPPTGRSGRMQMERYLQRRYEILTDNAIIDWDSIDKTGSDLADLETRNHNDLQFTRKTTNTDYDIIPTDDTIFADATLEMVTVTLPPAATAVGPHTIVKTDETVNVVRIMARPGEEVLQGLFFDLELQQEMVELTSDGTEWW